MSSRIDGYNAFVSDPNLTDKEACELWLLWLNGDSDGKLTERQLEQEGVRFIQDRESKRLARDGAREIRAMMKAGESFS